MISFGAISSNIVAQSFKLGSTPEGSGNLIIGNESGDRQLLYSVLFTPFLWGQRDIEKTVPLLNRVNPVFGITMSDTSDNGILGVSVDGVGFQLVGGFRYAHVTQLASGHQVGSPFTGAESTIPTTKRWKGCLFFGAAIDIDMRAAVVLFKTLVAAPAAAAK